MPVFVRFVAAPTLALLVGISLSAWSPAALGAEGMFRLDKLPVAALTRSGLKISPEKLRRLSRAVVQVARGGSGSFVSPHGLLVTNHHVAYRCLARLAAQKAHHGLLARGYLAKQRKDELPCPGYDLKVVERVEDVTAKVMAGVPEGTRRNYHQRFDKLRANREALRKACEADGRFVCSVVPNNGGVSFSLTVYRRVRDVRVVYAPPKALGKFGGDVDNWMFPRHTADFTYLRAYVGKDGQGRGYQQDNVPLATPIYLEQGRWGVARGKLTLVLGFPGRTSRHVTSHAARFYAEHHLDEAIKLLEGAAATLATRTRASKVARRKYAGLDASLQNGLKYYRMSAEGFGRWKVVEQKLAAEKKLLAGLPPKERRAAKKLLKELGGVYATYAKQQRRYSALSRMARWAVPSLRAAFDIARWAVEKEKPEAKRKDARYLDKNIYRLREASKRLEDEIELPTERAMLGYFAGLAEQLPRAQRSTSIARLLRWSRGAEAKLKANARREKKSFEALYQATYGVAPAATPLARAVQMVLGSTQLLAHGDSDADRKRAVAERGRLLSAKRAEVAKSRDPLLVFARDLEVELRKLREGPLRIVEEYLGPVLRRRFITRYLQPSYPDANFTLRLSYGSVQDYHASATGKTHRYMTDLPGLLAKDKGRFPFKAPAWLKAAAKTKRGQRFRDAQIKAIPVNFTTTLDTTGGNSGSAVLDDHGRLVGLLFDGTPESILSDWQYLPKQQRSICFDIRFAHYLATLQGAEALLKELGVSRRSGPRAPRPAKSASRR